MQYRAINKYPPIKADITIITKPDVPYGDIAEVVSNKRMHTSFHKDYECTDIYQETPDSDKHTSFHLVVSGKKFPSSKTRPQPLHYRVTQQEMDLWQEFIQQDLVEQELGTIQDFQSKFIREALNVTRR